ncbi:hypothetical protein [Nocardioides bruguierae]|nr:hypothetical protein [Nocardioides bruguierae]
MKFLLLIAIVVAVVAAWRMRAVILGKILGQDPARIQRQIDRKKR